MIVMLEDERAVRLRMGHLWDSRSSSFFLFLLCSTSSLLFSLNSVRTEAVFRDAPQRDSIRVRRRWGIGGNDYVLEIRVLLGFWKGILELSAVEVDGIERLFRIEQGFSGGLEVLIRTD